MPTTTRSTPRSPRASTDALRPPVQTAGEHHSWTVEEYHRLGEAGGFLFGDLGPHETRVELLTGVIVNKYSDGETFEERRLVWTRDMYERLVENGGLEGLRVELIQGQILDKMSPQGSPHSAAVTMVMEAVQEAFGVGTTVRVQLPIRALQESEPEPDVAVVPGTPRDYLDHHPEACLLVVEVAESSLRHDRTKKLAVYTSGGFPEYWIVNLQDEVLEVYRDPAEDTYLSHTTLGKGETVAPLARSQAEINVADLLP